MALFEVFFCKYLLTEFLHQSPGEQPDFSKTEWFLNLCIEMYSTVSMGSVRKV